MSTSYISAALRREVVERAGNCCEYCRLSQGDLFFSLEVDHIIAEKHDGQTVADNLCLSCPDCNAFKGSDLASIDYAHDKAIVRLFNPRVDRWNDHFQLELITGYIEGLSPQGRVTVFLLRLNDDDRVVDRKQLMSANRYPCSKE